jgi:hypothetical protein
MKKSRVIGVRYANVGMICMMSRTGEITAETRRLRPATIPSGTPIAIAIRTAASIRPRVAMLASHRPSTPSETKPLIASTASRTPPNTSPSAPATPMIPGQPSEAITRLKTSTIDATPLRIGSRT